MAGRTTTPNETPSFDGWVASLGSSVDWPLLLLGSAVLLTVAAAWSVYRALRNPRRPLRESIWSEYKPVLLCIAALVGAALLIGIATALSTPNDESFQSNFLQGIFPSLVEDIAFFSLVGFIVILLQRREADRDRNIDDKIDLLFNAKRLRTNEIAYLRDQVRAVAADCQTSETDIDILQFDELNEIIQIDVSRRFRIANYLSSDSAEYEWQFKIRPDDPCGNSPCMTIFPSMTSLLLPDTQGKLRRTGDDETLHGLCEPIPNEIFTETRVMQIEPGHVREFRTRFRGWQHLFKVAAPANAPSDTDSESRPAFAREPDSYVVVFQRHWDEIIIHVKNSLQRPVRVTISGREKRTFELEPGDRLPRAYRIENAPANSPISVSFALA